VTNNDHPGDLVLLEVAHRLQPRLQPPMVALNGTVASGPKVRLAVAKWSRFPSRRLPEVLKAVNLGSPMARDSGGGRRFEVASATQAGSSLLHPVATLASVKVGVPATLRPLHLDPGSVGHAQPPAKNQPRPLGFR
jgi:hypothetical protein